MDKLLIVPELREELDKPNEITGLPKDHWLYAPSSCIWDMEKDANIDTPIPFISEEHKTAVRIAAKWAIRKATFNGKVADFDPDAMVQSFVYALCGQTDIVNIKDPQICEAS